MCNCPVGGSFDIVASSSDDRAPEDMAGMVMGVMALAMLKTLEG